MAVAAVAVVVAAGMTATAIGTSAETSAANGLVPAHTTTPNVAESTTEEVVGEEDPCPAIREAESLITDKEVTAGTITVAVPCRVIVI